MVAPISVTMPFSTCGKKASCCALLNRWISSTNSRVLLAGFAFLRARAVSIILRTSATPPRDRGKVLKMRFRHARNHRGDSGLAGAGRPVENRRAQFVAFNSAAKRLARRKQVRLPRDFIQRSRAHSGGKRRGIVRWRRHVSAGDFGVVGEKVHGLYCIAYGADFRGRKRKRIVVY